MGLELKQHESIDMKSYTHVAVTLAHKSCARFAAGRIISALYCDLHMNSNSFSFNISRTAKHLYKSFLSWIYLDTSDSKFLLNNLFRRFQTTIDQADRHHHPSPLNRVTRGLLIFKISLFPTRA